MRRALVLAAVVVLGAGCSLGGSSGPSSDVADAAKKTAGLSSGRVAMTGSVEGNAADETTLTGEGAFADGRGEMKLDVKRATTETTQIVYDGAVYYVKPSNATGLPPGKDWLKVDVAAYAPAAAADLSGFVQFIQVDPTRILGLIESGIEDVQEGGAEDVRGVSTTKYTGTLDLTKAPDASDDLEEAFDRVLEDAAFTEIPVTVWVDDEGLVRRLGYEIPIAADRGGGTAKVAVELYDFGVDVTIDVPSDDEAFDIGELATGGTTTTGVGPR
jgi:hypothetical protein